MEPFDDPVALGLLLRTSIDFGVKKPHSGAVRIHLEVQDVALRSTVRSTVWIRTEEV